jgi:hypothetical protein
MKNQKAFRLIFIFLFSLAAMSSRAQSDSALRKKISKDFCIEFSKVSGTIKKEDLEMELGMVILPLLSKYNDEIKSQWHLDPADKQDLEKIGYRIGQDAAMDCATFRNFIKENMDAIGNTSEEENKSLSGILVKIEGQPFTYLLIRTKTGKMEKLFWMDHFEGAEILSTEGKNLLNKEIRVGYKEQEVYDQVNNDYRKIKVLTGFGN